MNIKETENRFGVTIQTQGYYERHEIREIHRKLSEIIAGWDEHALPIEVPRTAGEQPTERQVAEHVNDKMENI